MRWLRRAAQSVLLACVVVGSASAADLPPVSKSPAAAAPVFWSWTGPYLGGSAGYGWIENSVPTGPSGFNFFNLSSTVPSTLKPDARGFVGGGQLGHNWQWSHLVLGIEADASGAWIKGDATQTGSVFTGASTSLISSAAAQTLDWIGTVRGRVGYAPTLASLVYLTGGLAYGHVTSSFHVTSDTCQIICATGAASDARAGWALGGGIEYAVARNWTVKTEYLFYDLGRLAIPTTNSGTVVGSFAPVSQFTGSITRVGLNYKFN